MTIIFWVGTVALILIVVLIGYWIGTLPQRAAVAEKNAEMARRREANEAVLGDALRDGDDDWG